MIQQRTQEWLDARSTLLTASDFGAALGVNPYCSRQELFRRKIGQSVFEGNEATDWGTAHEPDAIFDYEVATGNLVQPCGLIVDGDYGASSDGLFDALGFIEAKCPFSLNVHTAISDYYMAQIQGVGWLGKKVYCHFISWTPQEMAVFLVHVSGEYIAWMRPHLADFVADWKAGREPKRRKKLIPPKIEYERFI